MIVLLLLQDVLLSQNVDVFTPSTGASVEKLPLVTCWIFAFLFVVCLSVVMLVGTAVCCCSKSKGTSAASSAFGVESSDKTSTATVTVEQCATSSFLAVAKKSRSSLGNGGKLDDAKQDFATMTSLQTDLNWNTVDGDYGGSRKDVPLEQNHQQISS